MARLPIEKTQNRIQLIPSQSNPALMDINKAFQQALTLLNQGNIQLAKSTFEQIVKINPKHFDALHLLEIISIQLKDFHSAINIFRKALKLNPHHIYCYCNLGNAYLETHELEIALINYNKAIEIQPNYADAYCYKALALTGLNRFEDAIANLNTAINLNPDFAEAYANLANVYKEQKQFEEALANYDKAIHIKPDFAMAFSNRGSVLKELNRTDEALESFKKAIGIQPNYAEAYFNLGNTLKNINRYDEALMYFDKAIQLKEDYAEAYWNKATALLEMGSFEGAWQLYDWRWKNKELGLKPLVTSKPLATDLQSLQNKKILVWGEQGVGDQVLYAGMLGELLSTASVVHLRLDPRISPLLHRLMPTAIFHDEKSNIKDIDFDVHLPMADLAKFFRTDAVSFSRNPRPYLQADALQVSQLRKSLLQNKKFLCGITWNSKREKIGHEKSMALNDLLPILAIEGMSFVSLQYGNVKEQIAEFNLSHGLNIQVCEAIDNFQDLDGHAALIEACDFVVSISNTSAHMSGALGKETYLMCPAGKGALWYWSNEIDGKSMWYPSIHIFRQELPGQWSDVVEKVRNTLLSKFSVGD